MQCHVFWFVENRWTCSGIMDPQHQIMVLNSGVLMGINCTRFVPDDLLYLLLKKIGLMRKLFILLLDN